MHRQHYRVSQRSDALKGKLHVALHPALARFAAWAIGRLVNDVFLTREEIDGLMADLLCTSSRPAGETRLTDWVQKAVDLRGRDF